MDGIVSLLRALDNGTTWWMGGSSSGGGVKDRHSGLRVLSYHKSKPVHGGKNFLLIVCRKVIKNSTRSLLKRLPWVIKIYLIYQTSL